MSLIPPFFMDAVVAVGFPGSNGKPSYLATGFLYGDFLKAVEEHTRRYGIYLITNRHVFEGRSKAFLRFNPEGEESAREFDLDLETPGGDQLWHSHPDDEVDVAAIGINGQMLRDEGIKFQWFQSDRHVMTRARATELGVGEGDGVFVLGFPLGLVGEGRNFVIVRQGALARIRDCLGLSRKDFLIDCSVFPGNSGGPVVTRPEITSITGTRSIQVANLIGVVAAYVPYRDVAVSPQTGSTRVMFEENSGLAQVYPVDYIQDVVSQVRNATPPPLEEAPSEAADA